VINLDRVRPVDQAGVLYVFRDRHISLRTRKQQLISRLLGEWAEEFNPVAEWVINVETIKTRKWFVDVDGYAILLEVSSRHPNIGNN
jgi:hypothetical protein